MLMTTFLKSGLTTKSPKTISMIATINDPRKIRTCLAGSETYCRRLLIALETVTIIEITTSINVIKMTAMSGADASANGMVVHLSC